MVQVPGSEPAKSAIIEAKKCMRILLWSKLRTTMQQTHDSDRWGKPERVNSSLRTVVMYVLISQVLISMSETHIQICD